MMTKGFFFFSSLLLLRRRLRGTGGGAFIAHSARNAASPTANPAHVTTAMGSTWRTLRGITVAFRDWPVSPWPVLLA